ncbi:MAG TPA: Maf family protein [Candidatus Eremiobacteraceae bacterium]
MTERLRAVSLASSSPRRLDLLRSIGLDVTVLRSEYEEINELGPDSDPRALALRHAHGKAAAAEAHGPPLLVAADTLVVIEGAVLGKPRDAADARRMLGLLAGREHEVHTAFVVLDRGAGDYRDGVESARVRFVALDEQRIARYVATGEPMDKAGAYGIQGKGALNVMSIHGDFYAVMGLPLARLDQAFTALGYELL